MCSKGIKSEHGLTTALVLQVRVLKLWYVAFGEFRVKRIWFDGA